VNGLQVTIPYYKPFFGYTVISENGYIVLSSQFGIVVMYDGDHIIFVGIADDYKNGVEGMCNYVTYSVLCSWSRIVAPSPIA